MTYEEKMNAITRLIILITILGYILTMSIRILVIGIITIVIIFALFKMKKQKVTKEMMLKEGFVVEGDKVYDLEYKNPNNRITNPETLESVLKSDFKEGNKKNPFSNVLLTQINDEPNRKSAPPSFNPDVDVDITKNVKKAVQFMNPGIKNTDKQLYGDLWENFELDNSNRVFFSTANTRVANDQGAFGKFLYGNMPSAKGSTMEDNIQREKDNYRYTLY
jgi:ABC-type methionine transport system ATPase subunit